MDVGSSRLTYIYVRAGMCARCVALGLRLGLCDLCVGGSGLGLGGRDVLAAELGPLGLLVCHGAGPDGEELLQAVVVRWAGNQRVRATVASAAGRLSAAGGTALSPLHMREHRLWQAGRHQASEIAPRVATPAQAREQHSPIRKPSDNVR